MTSPAVQRCSRCNKVKPVSAFGSNKGRRGGLQAYCRPCCNQRNRRARVEAYGISLEDYDAMLKRQGGRCAICHRKSGSSLSIDHDHSCCSTARKSCGRCVRGLLCQPCNRRLLGMLCQENTKGKEHAIGVLRRAIDYLNRVDIDHSHEITS